ncbi:hypothetical protein VE26_05770 [Devosia chinhatensis]|uniref:Uncharacterized protein n=1 Tax=Devosia chinhatensis TaxID=429727 RepID=A0A0F5FKQ7_9HYPH|nr:hypothetical protein VE26_05770 [Devosia chinhatensis]
MILVMGARTKLSFGPLILVVDSRPAPHLFTALAASAMEMAVAWASDAKLRPIAEPTFISAASTARLPSWKESGHKGNLSQL